MATVIKTLEVTGSDTSADTDLQPAASKMWWFKEVRHAYVSNNSGNSCLVKRIIGGASPTVITVGSGADSGSESVTTNAGHWATNAAYVRVDPTYNANNLDFSIVWLGVEVDT